MAKHFNYSFVDADDLIEKKAGMIIKDIFSKFGEKHFRDLETEVLRELSEQQNQIVATGGGAVLREENRDLIKKHEGVIVYLKTSPEVIYKRTSHSDKRPLLNTGDQQAAINKLYSQRAGIYENTAMITCKTDEKSASAVAEEIESSIQEVEEFKRGLEK